MVVIMIFIDIDNFLEWYNKEHKNQIKPLQLKTKTIDSAPFTYDDQILQIQAYFFDSTPDSLENTIVTLNTISFCGNIIACSVKSKRETIIFTEPHNARLYFERITERKYCSIAFLISEYQKSAQKFLCSDVKVIPHCIKTNSSCLKVEYEYYCKGKLVCKSDGDITSAADCNTKESVVLK